MSQDTLPVGLLESFQQLELTVLRPSCCIPDGFGICASHVPVLVSALVKIGMACWSVSAEHQ